MTEVLDLAGQFWCASFCFVLLCLLVGVHVDKSTLLKMSKDSEMELYHSKPLTGIGLGIDLCRQSRLGSVFV
jgi:hypothetical protein